MTREEIEGRIAAIGAGLDQLKHGWSFLSAEVEKRIGEQINNLVNQENEQTRGQIKALRWVLNLPSDLEVERDGMRAALPDEDAAS